MRRDWHIESAFYFFDDLERLAQRGSARPVGARDELRRKLHQPSNVFIQAFFTRFGFGWKQLERNRKFVLFKKVLKGHATGFQVIVGRPNERDITHSNMRNPNQQGEDAPNWLWRENFGASGIGFQPVMRAVALVTGWKPILLCTTKTQADRLLSHQGAGH